MNRYLVNTEGTVVRQGYTGYAAGISVGGQAPDGMRLSRDNGTTAADAKDLETWPAFRKRVIDDLKSLEALRTAPVVSAEDYHGPVLFSGDAAADVMQRASSCPTSRQIVRRWGRRRGPPGRMRRATSRACCRRC